MDLAYVAHSERCALLLDGDGICRWIVPKAGASDDVVLAAKRCVGAQYVASLDPEAPGYLRHDPRVGTSLLFALVTNGRVSLVRFGPLQSFEKLEAAQAAAPPAPTARSLPADVEADEEADDREIEPLPPTLMTPPELDDVIASLADDFVLRLDPVHPSSEALTPKMPVADLDDELELETGSFAPASVRTPIDDEPDLVESELETLLAIPVAEETAEAIEASLDRLAALTPAPAEPGRGPDDSQLEVTTFFSRGALLPKPADPAEDLDLDIQLDTGSFARASGRDVASAPATEEDALRPSGFVRKSAPAETERDDATRRFSRAAGGGLPFVEQLPEQTPTPRRGMLPRR